ncbi:MAG: radical SAM protein [Candidatus Thermoplasmatota archaeon]|nr:radical SAM protein [Candidatus Thermoplasmatota archaeon]
MIDEQRLRKAYETDGFYALQLEVGDQCFQDCVYCYMNAVEQEHNTLSDQQITAILHDARQLDFCAIEWLGGEPLLRGSIFDHMALAHKLGFRNNIWTGGLPLANPSVAEKAVAYANPGLISVHVSSVNPEIYQRLHPHRSTDDLYTILSAIGRVLDLGYPASQLLNSVTFTGLQTADDMIATMEYFEKQFGMLTSLNIYHTYLRPGSPSMDLERFIPSREEVAKVYHYYAQQHGVYQVPMNCVNKYYCSATVAVLCDGGITPCATIRDPAAPSIHGHDSFREIVDRHKDYLILKSMKDGTKLPSSCASCLLSSICWGCRSRAYAAGRGIYGRDPRCFRTSESWRQKYA